MSNPLFRQSALESLSSPEQLDQLMQITRPRAWIALCAIGVILVATVLWGILGSLPTNVMGEGLMIREGGIFNVVSYGSGNITEIADLRPGDKVRKGQIIATVVQPALELQVAAARADLERLKIEQKDVSHRLTLEKPAQGNARKAQQQMQEQVIQAREEQLQSLRTVERQKAELLREGLITRQRYEETRQAILAAESEIGNARSVLQKLVVDQLMDSAGHDERQRAIDSRVAQANNRLSELQLQLQLASSVASPLNGVVVEVLAKRGGTVKVGQPIISAKSDQRIHLAVIFVPPRSMAQRVKRGMPVQISPVTAKKELYGYIVGKVISVARYPATEQGMMAIFNNEALVRDLSKAGPPIAVEVELFTDPATVSGYKWSSQAGAAVDVHSGTICLATFVVERKRPISLIIPLLKETVGL